MEITTKVDWWRRQFVSKCLAPSSCVAEDGLCLNCLDSTSCDAVYGVQDGMCVCAHARARVCVCTCVYVCVCDLSSSHFFVKLKVLCVLYGSLFFNWRCCVYCLAPTLLWSWRCCVYCMAPIFFLNWRCCVYCLTSSSCNVEEGSITICTLLGSEDSFFLIWLLGLVMLKKGVYIHTHFLV